MAYINCLILISLSIVCVNITLADEFDAERYSEDDYTGEGPHSAEAPKDAGFVTPLDFSPLFDSGAFGFARTQATASPTVNVFQLAPAQGRFLGAYDAAAAGSGAFQAQPSAIDKTFSPESFGFRPIFSQGLVSAQAPLPTRFQQNGPEIERTKATSLTRSPLQYNIQTQHDPNYRVYIPEPENDNQGILAALKNNPAVASYFKPAATTFEINHPRELASDVEDISASLRLQPPHLNQKISNYKANAYIPGAASNPINHRIRRYTDGRRKKYARQTKKEEESPYDYRYDYHSRPKDFDNGPYSSNYKSAEKEEDDDAAYDYGSDSIYNNDEYERIKALSQAQAAEIKQNPENCKEVKKDSMTCTVCANPKTGGNFESCAYVSEPKNSKYAYLNEKKFDSQDAPDEDEKKPSSEEAAKPAKYESSEKSEPKQDVEEVSVKPSAAKYQSSYKAPSTHEKYRSADTKKPYHGYQREPKEGASDDVYKKQYSGPPDSSKSSQYRSSEEDDDEREAPREEKEKAYDYKSAIPGFYSDNEPKKDVEHVLAEFKKKDRSACKKVNKNGMTCYQCVDKSGLKHEECMFISESAPKRSHLAYQELKEFTSKPATVNDAGNEEAESQIVTTSKPLTSAADAPKSAALTDSYGQKLKRKKVNSDAFTTASTASAQKVNPSTQAAQPSLRVARRHKAPITKRSELSKSKDDPEENAKIIDETNIAPPEDFAGANSKGAFWAETVPRYSRSLGVSLPEFMLAKSEHEISFDETVAGG